MARPKKEGLDYFPFDVNFFEDIKIRRLLVLCGPLSASVYISLLCSIYQGKGYYIESDDDLSFLIADTLGIKEDEAADSISKTIKVGLFDENKFINHGILTSEGIQRRYIMATDRRKKIDLITEFLLLPKSELTSSNINIVSVTPCSINQVNEDTNRVSVAETTQSKVKESKVNNTIQYIESEKVILPEGLKRTLDSLLSDSEQTAHWRYTISRNNRIEPKEKLKDYLNQFFGVLANRGEIYKDETDAKFHFANWLTDELRKEKDEKTKYNNKPRKANRNAEGVKPAGIKSISLD